MPTVSVLSSALLPAPCRHGPDTEAQGRCPVELNLLRENCCPSWWGPLSRRMWASVPDSFSPLQTCSGWAWGQDILEMPDFCQGSGLRAPLGVPLRGPCWQLQPCQHLVLCSQILSSKCSPNALRCLVCTSCRNPNPCSKG